MYFKIMSTLFGAIFLLTILSSCVNTKVGGTVSYRDDAGKISENYLTDCWGQCRRISSDGKCVQFQSDVSQICFDFLSKANRLKPVVNQGDDSVYIGGDVHSGGDSNIKSSK